MGIPFALMRDGISSPKGRHLEWDLTGSLFFFFLSSFLPNL
jgi:hypothetical protein